MPKATNYNVVTSDFAKIKSIFRSNRAIAKICRCTEANVSIWKHQGWIPANHVSTIYQAAKGRLALTDIRSDFAFN